MLRRCLLGRWLLLALLGGRLAACGPGAAPADPTITFGASISITGKTAKEGEYALDGYQMFMDTINAAGGITVAGTAYKLRLRYYDDQSDPELTTQLYEKLVTEDQVDFLLGPYGSGPTAAATTPGRPRRPSRRPSAPPTPTTSRCLTRWPSQRRR